MTEDDFQYDVAFSFLEEDESLATQINGLIQDRLRTFIYSQKQKEIAGKDGELMFGRIFGSQARIVLVLYRKGWGETPWTRIEKHAIQNRAYDKGYDFVLLAPLDKPPTPPEWLPKNRIWIDLERWGIEGAASIIEAKIKEVGGEVKEETAEGRAIRLIREIDAEKERRRIKDSTEGVQTANLEVNQLFKEFQEIVNHLSKEKTFVVLEIKIIRRKCVMRGGGFSIFLSWETVYGNTLDSSALFVYLFKGDFILPEERSVVWERAKKLEEFEFNFDFTKSGSPIWKQVGNHHSYSTKELAKFVITIFVGKIHEHEISQK
jgi:hypothetical protein